MTQFAIAFCPFYLKLVKRDHRIRDNINKVHPKYKKGSFAHVSLSQSRYRFNPSPSSSFDHQRWPSQS
jgi:hypothetical protein